MKKLLILLLLIPNLILAKPVYDTSMDALTQSGMSLSLAKRCSEIVNIWNKAKEEGKQAEQMMSTTYGMVMIGMITGYNFANHDHNGGYGLEVSRTDPQFLFQYLMNECQQDLKMLIGIIMFKYIREQKELGNIYEW